MRLHDRIRTFTSALLLAGSCFAPNAALSAAGTDSTRSWSATTTASVFEPPASPAGTAGGDARPRSPANDRVLTGGEARTMSLWGTLVPAGVGALLVSTNVSRTLEGTASSPAASAGGVLLALGALAGPSTGYYAAGLRDRGGATTMLRLVSLTAAARTDPGREGRWPRTAAYAAIGALAVWDLTHVAADVERERERTSLSIEPRPEGATLSLRASF